MKIAKRCGIEFCSTREIMKKMIGIVIARQKYKITICSRSKKPTRAPYLDDFLGAFDRLFRQLDQRHVLQRQRTGEIHRVLQGLQVGLGVLECLGERQQDLLDAQVSVVGGGGGKWVSGWMGECMERWDEML